MRLDLILDPSCTALTTRREVREVVLDAIYPAQLPMNMVDTFGWRDDPHDDSRVLYVRFVDCPLYADVTVVSSLIEALMTAGRTDVTVEWGRDGETMLLILRQPLD
jgi:hypothetical protein